MFSLLGMHKMILRISNIYFTANSTNLWNCSRQVQKEDFLLISWFLSIVCVIQSTIYILTISQWQKATLYGSALADRKVLYRNGRSSRNSSQYKKANKPSFEIFKSGQFSILMKNWCPVIMNVCFDTGVTSFTLRYFEYILVFLFLLFILVPS